MPENFDLNFSNIAGFVRRQILYSLFFSCSASSIFTGLHRIISLFRGKTSAGQYEYNSLLFNRFETAANQAVRR